MPNPAETPWILQAAMHKARESNDAGVNAGAWFATGIITVAVAMCGLLGYGIFLALTRI